MKLQAENITKICNGKRVLDHISLTLEPGKIYGITGRIGVGKTTLFSILSGRAPADEGTLHLYNDEGALKEISPGRVCFPEDLSLVIRKKGHQGQTITEYFRELSLLYPNWDNDLANTLASRFLFPPDKKLADLSKGMMSMVTIICALSSKADFTLLDEPEAGMDSLSREKFYRMLLEEFADSGRTFVLATHLLDEVSELIDEVIFLDYGDKRTLDCGHILLMENTRRLLARSFLISGLQEKVEATLRGYEAYDMGNFGRSKSMAVLLKDGQRLPDSTDFTIKPLSLQKIFAALCSEE